MNRGILFVFVLFYVQATHAANADTVKIYSESMHKSFKCVVVTPDGYKKKKNVRFPVVYLLHGYDGDFSNWISKVPQLKRYADLFELIIVTPEGHSSSWYFDSPVDSSMRYETYISTEVPSYIDIHYRTVGNRNGRAITGLSMGGHGALFIAFRHPDTFSACGSMSGLTDLSFTRNKYELIKRIGDTVNYANYWINFSVINLIEKKIAEPLAVIFDCGIDDPFLKTNKNLHEKMLQLKIPHEYIERPGGHNWPYWGNAVQYQLLFFKNCFEKK